MFMRHNAWGSAANTFLQNIQCSLSPCVMQVLFTNGLCNGFFWGFSAQKSSGS